jgi:glutamate--cysteine ligase
MGGQATSGGARASAPVIRRAGQSVAASRVEAVDLHERVDRLFAGRRGAAPARVGVEVELIPVHGRPPRPTPASRTRQAILAHDPDLLTDACISFEPGGQVELSPPPQRSPAALLDELDGLLARLDGALARDGIVAVSAGLNPWHSAEEVGLQVEAQRYQVMQRHFDAIGPSGRDMMRLTAGLQVCVDLRAGEDGVEQWRLANRMGPALAAAFANSAVGGGEVTGWSGTRCQVWQKLDVTRTGFDGVQVDSLEPAAAYVRFAAAALAMPLARWRGPVMRVGGEAQPLRSFAAWQAEAGERPDAEDVAHHLSTLFPPVRPRGYLEVRYLDAPPRRFLAVPLLVVDTLLRDSGARRTALAALGDVDRPALLAMWDAAAHQGVVNPWLRREASTLLDIALDALPRLPADSIPRNAAAALRGFADEYLCSRRCWSDDQVERINGPDAEDPTAWT